MSDPSFAFDIETAPIQSVNKRLFVPQHFVDEPFPEISIPGNYKKPETIEKYRQEYEQKKHDYVASVNERIAEHQQAEKQRYEDFVQSGLLDATRSKVCCIAYWFADDSWRVEFRSEREMLTTLWQICNHCQRGQGTIYTASGTHFDLRFCWRRSLILGLEIPCRTFHWTGARPWPDRSFVDVSEVFGCGQYGFKVRVDELAAGFGLDGKTGNHGPTFWKLMHEDREAAEAYARDDARIAWQLGRRLRASGLHIPSVRADSELLA